MKGLPRIANLDPPYSRPVTDAIFAIHPKESTREPLKLFRVIAKNLPLCDRMFKLGCYLLGRNTDSAAGYDLRTRELIIDRTTARCACEYEWGVHVAAYGEDAGITADQAHSLLHGSAVDTCWNDQDRLTLMFADQLHDTGHVDEATWSAMRERFDENTLLDLLVLVGWYHAISYIANGAQVERETWSKQFPAQRPHGPPNCVNTPVVT